MGVFSFNMGGGQSRSTNDASLHNAPLTLYEMRVASKLHDFWRAPRKQADGTYLPRVKTYNGREYDIANLTFRKLPPKMQYENLISTKILCDSVVKHRNQKKGDFTHSFMEETARKLHEAWRGRNLQKAKAAAEAKPEAGTDTSSKKVDESQIPYKKLSEQGKAKVRNFVKLAVDIYNDMDCAV